MRVMQMMILMPANMIHVIDTTRKRSEESLQLFWKRKPRLGSAGLVRVFVGLFTRLPAPSGHDNGSAALLTCGPFEGIPHFASKGRGVKRGKGAC
jgi:hypothetical protein